MNNLNVRPGMIIVALDGDGIGKKCGRAVLADDVDALHEVSRRIDAAQDLILNWASNRDGIKISGGGDEAVIALDGEYRQDIESLRKEIEKKFDYTISVGVGRTLSEAGTALLVAKLRGKDRIVYFNKNIKADIKKAKRRVREGRASQEEYKLSEAYLEKSEGMPKICSLHKKEQHKKHLHALHKSEEGSPHADHISSDDSSPCPYCADEEDNRVDDCDMCADLDAEENADGTAGMHDCPQCQEYDAANQSIGNVDDGCPYCESETVGEAQAGTPAEQGAEDHHQCNCPSCPHNDQTDLAVEDAGAQRPDDCEQCNQLFSDAIEEQPDQTGQSDPNLQGHETAEEVLGLLDQEPGSGKMDPAQEAKQIDNTELPQGDQMKENTSVTENFGDRQKNDISDAEKDMGQPGHDCNCPDCPGSQEAVPMDMGDGGNSDDGSFAKDHPEHAQGQDQDEDEPDMTGVLQSGLDDHANDQKKQQVLNMVAQTLQGFKANKASLEATKEQNQPLYNSCIQMLKSMIELCKLLGLNPSAAPEAPANASPAQPPKAPPKAAPSEGAAQNPKL